LVAVADRFGLVVVGLGFFDLAAITDAGDQGLIVMAACQAYVSYATADAASE
jgi:hypothetical protein